MGTYFARRYKCIGQFRPRTTTSLTAIVFSFVQLYVDVSVSIIVKCVLLLYSI